MIKALFALTAEKDHEMGFHLVGVFLLLNALVGGRRRRRRRRWRRRWWQKCMGKDEIEEEKDTVLRPFFRSSIYVRS